MVDKITKLPRNRQDKPNKDVVLNSVKIAADVDGFKFRGKGGILNVPPDLMTAGSGSNRKRTVAG